MAEERIVVDTDVLIEAFERGKKGLIFWLASRDTYISYVSLYEYLWGFARIGGDVDAEKKALEKVVKVVYPTQELLLKAMRIDVDLAARGEKVPQADILVAATALTLRAPLATRNRRRFERMTRYGLRLEEPPHV